MGRRPCCDKVGIKKGTWSAEEDNKLINFILSNGQYCWRAVPKLAGLLRCGKSCRLRWTNYLRPDLKRGLLSEHDENIVIDLHAKLGNKWSKIASHLPGRTDNEIKNHWNTHIKKKLKKLGIDPTTHKPVSVGAETPQNQQQEEDDSREIDKLTMRSSKEVEDKRKMTANISTSTSFFEFDTLMEQGNYNNNNNEFCIDEVPVVEPHEIDIQLPPTSPPCSSSTSSISFDNNKNEGMQQVFQNSDWQLIEDFVNMSSLLDDDDLIPLDNSCFSVIHNDDMSCYYHYNGIFLQHDA